MKNKNKISNIYKEIFFDYEKLQIKAQKNLKLKRLQSYEKCPLLKEIDDELNETGLKISKAIVLSTPNQKQTYLKEIRYTVEKLNKQKKELLKENGFEKDFFKDIYECKKCEDTGFINNQKCTCFKQKFINKYYIELDLLKVLKGSNLSDFSLEYYPKENLKKYNLPTSPYDFMKNVLLKRVLLFIDEFGTKSQNIIFTGTEGLGKTFLCRCIGNELLNKGYTVLYITSFNLFELYEKRQFSKSMSDLELRILDIVLDVDLLIIDDLGTEFRINSNLSEFFNIVNSRIILEKSTIISTNLNIKEIDTNYSTRVFSRIFGEYESFKFAGEDIRLKIRLSKNKQINFNTINDFKDFKDFKEF